MGRTLPYPDRLWGSRGGDAVNRALFTLAADADTAATLRAEAHAAEQIGARLWHRAVKP